MESRNDTGCPGLHDAARLRAGDATFVIDAVYDTCGQSSSDQEHARVAQAPAAPAWLLYTFCTTGW